MLVQCSLYWTRSRAEAGIQLGGCLGHLGERCGLPSLGLDHLQEE